MTWCLMLMYLDQQLVTGFSARSTAPLLSPCRGTASSMVYPSSFKKPWYQTAWLAASAKAMYSASDVLWVMVFCLQDDQEIVPLASKNI